eukprot:847724-Pyramimonas_sp.AAC.1
MFGSWPVLNLSTRLRPENYRIGCHINFASRNVQNLIETIQAQHNWKHLGKMQQKSMKYDVAERISSAQLG